MSWLKNKSLRRRMLIVAMINCFLIFGSVYTLSKAIEKQNDDALLVNLAGRQRMLSQRMSKASIALSLSSLDKGEREEMRSVLTESKHLYGETLGMFMYGGKTEIGGNQVSTPPITVHILTFKALYDRWSDFENAIDIVLESPRQTKDEQNEFATAINYIIRENETLLWQTDEIVTILQVDAETHVNRVKKIMVAIVMLEIVVLLYFIRSINIGIIRPFKKLLQIIESVGRGERYLPIQQELYLEWIQAFQHISDMNEKLYLAKEDLNSLNQVLEDKVISRTIDLEDTLHKLEKTYKKLLESEKQASLGALVAGVAHEVNTPLGVCLTGSTQLSDESELLLKKIKENQMTKGDLIDYLSISSELIKILVFNINRASEIIRSFKKIAIHQSTEIVESFYLDEYINELWISLSHVTKKYKTTFKNQLLHRLIYGDPGDYSQIFTNLIMNTFVHGYEVGEDVIIEINSIENDECLEISYKDYGKGIKAENLDKIFDPFYTTNRTGGGSGLGLNVIYQIVATKLGGEIICNSELGVSTEFRIKISKYKEAYYEQ